VPVRGSAAAPTSSSPAIEAFDVIVEDDEEEDEDGIPLTPIESGVTEALLAGKARGDSGPSRDSGFRLADLADEDEDSPPPPRRQAPPVPRVPTDDPGGDDPGSFLEDAGADDLGEAGDEDEELVEGLTPSRSMAAVEPETRSLKWVYAGIGGGIALILLVIVINLVIKPSKDPELNPPEVARQDPEPPAVEPEPAPQPAPPPPPPVATIARATPTLPAGPGAAAKGARTPGEAASAAPAKAVPPPDWSEPGDLAVEPVAEAPVSPDLEASFALPAWAKAPIPQRLGGTSFKVRRISDPGNAQERPSLGSAFDSTIGNGTTELIDDGPFLESDLRLHGDARLVRALEGRRPIVRLEPPKLPVIREQPALFVLDGKQLTLDGLDLIVDLQDLPREHSSLFDCEGGSLTLSRCTVTVVNPLNRPFSLIRARGSERPAQVRLEETFIRAGVTTAIEIDGGGVEVAVVRSVLVGGQGPLLLSTGNAAGGERQLHFQRSILASRGPFLELTTPMSGRPAPIAVRALSTTFARFRSDALVSLVAFHDEVGEPRDLVRWMGEHNSFLGWNDWSAMGNGHAIKIASLAAARTTWPGSDLQSRELPNAWPIPPDFTRVLPDQMKTLAPHEQSTLVRVASPSPFLWEKTIEEFRRPELPTYFSPVPNVVLTDDGNPAEPQPAPPPEVPHPANPNAPVDPNAPPVVAVKDLVFDVSAKPWSGNLGLYLAEQVRAGDARVKVRVSGTGRFAFTPVRLPEATSLEVVVETTRANGGVPPSWTVPRGAKADALIDARRGNLVLTGVELTRDPTSGLKVLLRVDDGHLVVNHCRLLSTPGVAELGGGNLIAFRAASSRPLSPAKTPSPFDKPADKPTCRIIDSVLIATGDVLTAEVGRGMLALTQCGIAAGGNAFVLLPAAVARGRFEADLWIERCTLAAEKTFVLLGPWPGSPPGPDRPWLVTSRDSAYMSSYNPVSRESVLLRVEPNSLAQGALFWQGANDAYEMTNFTSRADRPTVMNPHPDVHRQWVSIWGANHFRSITGPPRSSGGSVKLHDRLRPGDVTPGELALEQGGHSGRIGVDMRRLQVTPGAPRGRPRR
jgi:eukaryotic-like serine/threonine-protein kinase